jgi:hypothetical protein
MINKLETLARAATPGEWSATEICNVWSDAGFICNTAGRHEDAAYIAAANPATMLKLIKVIRAQHEAMGLARHDLLAIAPPGSRTIRALSAALAKANEVLGGE